MYNRCMGSVRAQRFSALEEKVLKRLSETIGTEMPEAVELIVFGSRARGASGEESDLDVAVVLRRASIDGGIWEKLWNIKWRALESLDAEEFPLSLVPVPERDLLAGGGELERRIKTEGISVWKRPD